MHLGGQLAKVGTAVAMGVDEAEQPETEQELDGQECLLPTLPLACRNPTPLLPCLSVGQVEAEVNQFF